MEGLVFPSQKHNKIRRSLGDRITDLTISMIMILVDHNGFVPVLQHAAGFRRKVRGYH